MKNVAFIPPLLNLLQQMAMNIHVVESINVMPVDISKLNLESLLVSFALNEFSLSWRPICQYTGCFKEQVSIL